jgi:hypothetical protein
MIKNLATGCFDRLQRDRDVGGFPKAKTEMDNTSALPCPLGLLLKHKHVERARRLRLHKTFLLINWHNTEHALIEFQRAFGIASRCGKDELRSMKYKAKAKRPPARGRSALSR